MVFKNTDFGLQPVLFQEFAFVSVQKREKSLLSKMVPFLIFTPQHPPSTKHTEAAGAAPRSAGRAQPQLSEGSRPRRARSAELLAETSRAPSIFVLLIIKRVAESLRKKRGLTEK